MAPFAYTNAVHPRRTFILAMAAVLVALAVHAPSLLQPVNRDTSAYATIGQLISRGYLPYRDVFDHKQPLSYVLYWLLGVVAPRSSLAIQLASAVLSGLAGAAVVFLLAEPLGRWRAGLIAVLIVTFGATRFVEGADLNTEHVLADLTVVLVLLPAFRRRPASAGFTFAVGLLSGLALLAKSVAVLTLPAVGLALLVMPGALPWWRRLVGWAVGAALPLGLVVGLYAVNGALPDFIYANLTFNVTYVGTHQTPNLLAWLNFGGALGGLLLLALLVGFLRLAATDGRDRLTWIVLLWLVGAVIGARVSGRNFPHYFAPVVPPAVVLACLPALAAEPKLRRRLKWEQAIGLGLLSVIFAQDLLINATLSPAQQAERLFGEPAKLWEVQDAVGAWLRERADPAATLFVNGSEPGFYWQSGLRPATRFIYDSAVRDDPSLTTAYETELITHPPDYLIHVEAVEANTAYQTLLAQAPYDLIYDSNLVQIYALRATD